MTNSELVKTVSTATGVPKKQVDSVLATTYLMVAQQLKRGGSVVLTNFGTFKVGRSAATRGVNPITLEPIAIAAKKYPKFTSSSKFKAGI